jgi:SAM-dependent MidA family methyltransferase
MEPATSLTTQLEARIAGEIAREGGWIGFEQYMAMALYTPGLGYYANDLRKFGAMPSSGSDFVTAPGMTPLFGQTLAVQVEQALQLTQTDEVWEFGAGSGALASQLLEALGDKLSRYTIVELSATLRERQQELLAAHLDKVRWVNELPGAMRGVIVGNEVLDAMPVTLLARVNGVWHERGVCHERDLALQADALVWADRATDLRPPIEVPGTHDYLTEIHPQAEAFIRTLAERLTQGAAFFLDYGFPQAEYYHPQRHMGTVMCHKAHLADADPLAEVGHKDITAHVDFTGIALAAQDAGFEVAGYTSQARFLFNCGLVQRLEGASLSERTLAQRLIHEHEMGELFKVIALVKNAGPDSLVGFAPGDRTHTL